MTRLVGMILPANHPPISPGGGRKSRRDYFLEIASAGPFNLVLCPWWETRFNTSAVWRRSRHTGSPGWPRAIRGRNDRRRNQLPPAGRLPQELAGKLPPAFSKRALLVLA
jgi:hypothetical protein